MKSIQQFAPRCQCLNLKLRPKVAELVHLLQDHAGQPVPIEIIGPQVWGYPVDASLLNTIYATVCEARRNLPDRRWIVTRRGWQQPGYAWAGPPPVVLEQERAA